MSRRINYEDLPAEAKALISEDQKSYIDEFEFWYKEGYVEAWYAEELLATWNPETKVWDW